ncbi:MAG: hypothetical protein V1875_06790 [Candidatus Altiarchaeota archaeon]
MPATVENPERLKPQLDMAPPIAATYAVEASQRLLPVTDMVSRAAIGRSNANVSLLLQNALRSTLKLSKTLFGKVSLNTFQSLRGMASVPIKTRGK